MKDAATAAAAAAAGVATTGAGGAPVAGVMAAAAAEGEGKVVSIAAAGGPPGGVLREGRAEEEEEEGEEEFFDPYKPLDAHVPGNLPLKPMQVRGGRMRRVLTSPVFLYFSSVHTVEHIFTLVCMFTPPGAQGVSIMHYVPVVTVVVGCPKRRAGGGGGMEGPWLRKLERPPARREVALSTARPLGGGR